MVSKITLAEIRESPRVVGVLMGLCAALLIILVRNNGGLQFLDLDSYDLLLGLKSSRAITDPRVVLVTGTEAEDDQQALRTADCCRCPGHRSGYLPGYARAAGVG